MNITAKASTLRSALSQALTSLAASKPQETVSIEPSPAAVTIHGTKDAGYPLLRAKGETSAALCALLGIDQQPQTSDGQAAEIADLRRSIVELTEQADRAKAEAHNHQAVLRQCADNLRIVTADRDAMQARALHLTAQLAEQANEVRALKRTNDRQPTVAHVVQASAQPLSVESGRSLLAEITSATEAPASLAEVRTTTLPPLSPEQRRTVDYINQPTPEHEPMVTLSFPLNQQGRTLARAGLDVAKLKAAGFHFRFLDPKDAAKGGHWDAEPTAQARGIAERLGQL